MGVHLSRVDTVVAGKFNPHIISPPWLVREGIVENRANAPAEVSVRLDDRSAVLRYKLGDFTWEVDFNRLVVASSRPLDTAAFVAKVVEKLPHTPLSGVGNNFTYNCDLPEWQGGLPELRPAKSDALGNVGIVAGMTWSAMVEMSEERVMTVQLTVEHAKSLVTVTFNYHHPANDVAAVSKAARMFVTELDDSRRFVSTVLGAQVSP